MAHRLIIVYNAIETKFNIKHIPLTIYLKFIKENLYDIFGNNFLHLL